MLLCLTRSRFWLSPYFNSFGPFSLTGRGWTFLDLSINIKWHNRRVINSYEKKVFLWLIIFNITQISSYFLSFELFSQKFQLVSRNNVLSVAQTSIHTKPFEGQISLSIWYNNTSIYLLDLYSLSSYILLFSI